MSIRHVAGRVLVSIAAVAVTGGFGALALSSPAGASPPASGSVVPGSVVPDGADDTGPASPGPFSSGQNVDIEIPANSAFASPDNTSGVNILECSAPNGVVPTTPSACDGNTIQGNTILPNADGSFTFDDYTLYALPDSISLGETGGVNCGNTAATECILYIGNNQSDFTKPHLWSQPFFIKANSDDGGENPGDGTPEVPLAIVLPLSAMGVLGGTVALRRRRRAHQTQA